jgi:ABC-type Zn uptake system ZnuABC Zn-binding protein ZnuA
LTATAVAAGGCGSGGSTGEGDRLEVVTSATFLADITRNVAGDRADVSALVPGDTDLHGFEPTPRELARVAGADLLVLNGAGLEESLEETVRAAAGGVAVVEAAAGLEPRAPQPGEPLHEDEGDENHEDEAQGGDDDHDGDPHFWLDPTLVVSYVHTISDALAAADPEGAADYAANAAAYIAELEELDAWIEEQVARLPRERRRLVMDHVSHGYFADRYGFEIVGAVIPGVSTGVSPTAKQLAALAAAIRASGARAIFVESHADPRLARQIADETGIVVVDDLRDHGLTDPGGDAPTYIEMMKANTAHIVEALAP